MNTLLLICAIAIIAFSTSYLPAFPINLDISVTSVIMLLGPVLLGVIHLGQNLND